MGAFLRMLMGQRDREQSAALQERLAAYSVRPHPAIEVQATPQRPPVNPETWLLVRDINYRGGHHHGEEPRAH